MDSLEFRAFIHHIEATHNVKLQPYQIQLLEYLVNNKEKRIMFSNPLARMKSWIVQAAALAMTAMSNESQSAWKPRDFTPKPIGSVKLNSHHNSKSARKSRQKRGY